VVASQLLTMPNYTIPTNRTEYACMSFTADLPTNGTAGGRRQIVAAEALVDRTSVAGRMVHHFLIYSCVSTAGGFWDEFKDAPGSCMDHRPACRDILWVYVGELSSGGWAEVSPRRVAEVTAALLARGLELTGCGFGGRVVGVLGSLGAPAGGRLAGTRCSCPPRRAFPSQRRSASTLCRYGILPAATNGEVWVADRALLL